MTNLVLERTETPLAYAGNALLSDSEQTLSRALGSTSLSPLVQAPGFLEVWPDAQDPPAGQHLRVVGFGQELCAEVGDVMRG